MYAARQPRDHEKAGSTKGGGHLAGEFETEGGSGAGTDDCRRRQFQDRRIAFHAKQDGRLVDLPQERRIARLANGDEPRPQRPGAIDIPHGFLVGVDALAAGHAAAPVEIGQGGESLGGAAEAVDQHAEGRRPDILAHDQAQPVDPLLVAQKPFHPPPPTTGDRV